MLANALVLLGAAILVATVFHTVKIPPIVAFITAGILVGPSVTGLISSLPQVELLTEASAVLLMFTIGLEFSLKELLHYRRPILILGLSQILLTILIFTFLFWLAFSFPIEKAIFLSFLVAPSSTAVVLKLLSDNRDLESPYGKASFSVLLMQDIAIIPMIVTIPFLVSSNSPTASFLDSLLPLVLLALIAIALFYIMSKYALPYVFHRVSLTKNREVFFFLVLFVCMGSAAIMHQVGLSVSLGAFVAGMILAGSHYGKQATAEILPLRDSFLSLFFVAIGMMLDVHFVAKHIHQVVFLGVTIVLLKSIIIYSITWLTGNTGRVSRAVTTLLFQFGEFSFIMAELGTKNELLSEKDRQIFVAIAITSLALTPILYSRIAQIMDMSLSHKIIPNFLIQKLFNLRKFILGRMTQPLDFTKMETEKQIENHVVVIGFGISGQCLCRVLTHLKIPYQVIELNSETVRIHSQKIPIMFGDASNVQILKKAGVENARLVSIVTSGSNMLAPILQSVRKINPTVKVMARVNYLLDIKRLPRYDNVKFITSELEATLKIIDTTLREFHVDGPRADELVAQLREELN